jgi:transketolase
VYDAWDQRPRGAGLERDWNARFDAYAKAHPDLAKEFRRRMAGDLPANWAEVVAATVARTVDKAETIATRKASQNAIEAIAPHLPGFLGGSADLTWSNLTNWSGSKSVSATQAGNYLHFGVREFGMVAIGNGLALHGGFIPYSGTFLVFSDYARNAVRMAALMKLRNILVFTHDSIGLGEDGPTHQAVEHVSSLRLIPNLDLWRPCDTVETAVAWAEGVERRNGPTALALSRQNVPFVKRSPEQVAAISRGGYVLSEASGSPKAAILATGSEVSLALAAQKTLAEAGIPVRVVSMPCTSVFDRQDAAWKASVLPKGLPRVSVEAGITDFWRKYVGLEGATIGVDTFGESAPAGAVYKHFGVDADHVVAAVKSVL